MDGRLKGGVAQRAVYDVMSARRWNELTRRLGLSPRECDILRCILRDERTAAIGAELNLAEGTVHTYRERMFRKLGVRSCTQLVVAAFAAYLEMASEEDGADDTRAGMSSPDCNRHNVNARRAGECHGSDMP